MILKRVSFRGIKIAVLGKVDKVFVRFKRVGLKTKAGYGKIDIGTRAREVTTVSISGWRNFLSNLKTIFKRPASHVSHFGLILVILVVLVSGIPTPEALQKRGETLVDPFGLARSIEATTSDEVDVTELEVVAMSVSFIDTELADEVYQIIGEKSSDSQIILAGDTVANTSIISTESSSKLDKTSEEYIVQSGDTLSGIATKFGVSTNSIKWSNSRIKKRRRYQAGRDPKNSSRNRCFTQS